MSVPTLVTKQMLCSGTKQNVCVFVSYFIFVFRFAVSVYSQDLMDARVLCLNFIRDYAFCVCVKVCDSVSCISASLCICICVYM